VKKKTKKEKQPEHKGDREQQSKFFKYSANNNLGFYHINKNKGCW